MTGMAPARRVMRTWRARPWRMSAADYEAAVQDAPHTRRDLGEADVAPLWDSSLSTTMLQHGLSIAEEAVADSLIEDLRLT